MAHCLPFAATFIILLCASNGQYDVSNLLTNTSLGSIRGRSVSINNRQFGVYLRIPYAKPPIGSLRFENPVPVESWSPNVVDASQAQYGSMCPQPPYNRQLQNEDCLHLNIFTPRTNANAGSSYPVMFWIHGGAFLLGSASQFPEQGILENLVSRDVVVVTINYRLGPLGFWNTKSAVAPGNYGLRDQIMALQWVRDNIANFGGQPDRITLFGESAGGASVSYLTLAPSTRGLYSQAIMMSGSAFSPDFIKGDWESPDSNVDFAKRLNCYNLPVDMTMQQDAFQNLQMWGEQITKNLMDPSQLSNDPLIKTLRIKTTELIRNFTQQLFTGNFDQMAQTLPQHLMSFAPNVMQDRAMKNCMKNIPVEQLIAPKLDFPTGQAGPSLSMARVVRVDGTLLTKYPSQLADERPVTNVMIGVTKDEWAAFDLYYNPFEKTKDEVQKTVGHFVSSDLYPSNTEAIQKAFTYRYITLPDVTVHNQTDRLYWLRQKMKMISGAVFWAPAFKEAQKYVNKGSTVYLYSFDYNQEKPEVGWSGAGHASELPYLFNMAPPDSGNFQQGSQRSVQFSQSDRIVREYLVQLWTNFAKFGNPTPQPVQGVTWTPFRIEAANYLSIAPQPIMRDGFYADEVAFDRLIQDLETEAERLREEQRRLLEERQRLADEIQRLSSQKEEGSAVQPSHGPAADKCGKKNEPTEKLKKLKS